MTSLRMGVVYTCAISALVLFTLLVVTFVEAQGAQLQNPLNPAFSSVPSFIAGALKVVVMVALPLLTLAFVYSGFLFVKAQGNPTELQTARRNFMFTVFGAILILGAWVIATLIGGTVSQLVN